ncbi:SPOR domain-containing protein [Aquisediminimonas sediminicola]|uniref:SPOR domain-containing protein n=1 Tax=Alteraquisediminimonas sediminicola TaxID=2676787 RepID=UPI001C8EBB10|nr:SPOR domain-containing protein [Aquisediminimonas sediminicola]
MRNFLLFFSLMIIASGYASSLQAADNIASPHFDLLGSAHVTSGSLSSPISVSLPDAAGLEVVEITSLDSGQVILALPLAEVQYGHHDIMLSASAAAQLGISGNGGRVRVRRAVASPQDIAQLQAGKPATPRLSAPPTMLAALRQRFDAGDHVLLAAEPSPDASQPMPQTSPPFPAPSSTAGPLEMVTSIPQLPTDQSFDETTGLYVQVAALGDKARANKLANALKDIATPRLSSTGNITRVQIGPFNSMTDAQQALAEVRARGYVDARILHIP